MRRTIQRENRLAVSMPPEHLGEIVEKRWPPPGQYRVTVMRFRFFVNPRYIALAVEEDVVEPLFRRSVGKCDPLVRLTDPQPLRAVVFHPCLARASEVKDVASPAILTGMSGGQVIGIDGHKADDRSGAGSDTGVEGWPNNRRQSLLIVAPLLAHPI